MKKLALLSLLTLFAPCVSNAANVTLYYSPSCPHCHHAREFFRDRVAYEYPTVSITAVNVMDPENLPEFRSVLEKCELSSGGVPVIVVGEKCFQGYASFMGDEIRDAVAIDMTDDQRRIANENKSALDSDADAFRSAHAARANAIIERSDVTSEKKNDRGGNPIYFYGLIIVLIAVLGFVLVGHRKK